MQVIDDWIKCHCTLEYVCVHGQELLILNNESESKSQITFNSLFQDQRNRNKKAKSKETRKYKV